VSSGCPETLENRHSRKVVSADCPDTTQNKRLSGNYVCWLSGHLEEYDTLCGSCLDIASSCPDIEERT
jgi:hypothetical protein